MPQEVKTKPTHFIEQYRDVNNENDFDQTGIYKISLLESCLNTTKICEQKTICIFLITPKLQQ